MAVPAIVACFLSTPYWEVAFVAAFDYAPYLSASQTFRIMFGDSWQYFWPVIVVAVLQVFAASCIMSAVDRHFRTGKLSLRSPWNLINNSIFPMAIGVVVMSLMSIIWRFLLFGLVMLIQTVSQAMALPAGAALAVIAALAVGMFVLHIMIITPMLFWAPIMFIYGYRFRDAAAMSFKMISGKKLFVGLMIPMLFCIGLQLLIGFLQVHVSISCVVGFFTFLFTNIYVTVYTMISFCDISDRERRDLEPYYNAPLPRQPKPDEQERNKKAEQQKSPVNSELKEPKPAKKTKSVQGGKKSDKNKAEKPKSAGSVKKRAEGTGKPAKPHSDRSAGKEAGDGV